MKKTEQKEINKKVESFIDRFNANTEELNSVKQLRSCQAKVYTYDSFYVLQSYGTIVAAIDRDTGIAYDFLRKVYGYTSTSAQHISKFFHDYSFAKWYPETVYTWRYC